MQEQDTSTAVCLHIWRRRAPLMATGAHSESMSCLASVWESHRMHTWPSAREAPFDKLGPQHTKRHLAWGRMSAGQQSYRTHTACMWGLVEHLKGRLGKPDLGHSVQSALGLSAGHTLQ